MPDPFGYASKRVVVTGGATGVGAALLELLAEIGAPSVTVLDIKQPTGPHDEFIEVDLGDQSAVDAAIAAIDGPIDVLFNNAGVNSTAGLRTTVSVNFLALRRLSEGLLGRIRPGGAVVNTASSAGNNWAAHLEELDEFLAIDGWEPAVSWVEAREARFDVPNADIYFFSKELVQLWTLRWAPVARTAGVRVSSVCPAPIDTPLLADFRRTITDKVIDWNIAQAGGRLMTAREVAMPLAFLGSDAASYISGVNLVVDGGFNAALSTGQLDFSGLR
jgi:NAD(P)-dependent dehydrogenase (short-subunit alcohol dehydrogenase family)